MPTFNITRRNTELNYEISSELWKNLYMTTLICKDNIKRDLQKSKDIFVFWEQNIQDYFTEGRLTRIKHMSQMGNTAVQFTIDTLLWRTASNIVGWWDKMKPKPLEAQSLVRSLLWPYLYILKEYLRASSFAPWLAILPNTCHPSSISSLYHQYRISIAYLLHQRLSAFICSRWKCWDQI